MTPLPPSTDPQTPLAWTARRKVVVSALLLFHLLAIFAGPCASPPPASYSWNWLAGRVDGKDGLLMPYLRAGYLNHGYRFFAPEPGPSHLVRYELDLKSGAKVEGKFPDPDEQWPRLLYHRMFMISETLFNLGELPVLDNPTPRQQSDIQTQRELANALASSIARRLLDQNKGERVRLYVQTHLIPWPGDVLAGQQLDDPSLYQERFVGEFSEDQL